MGEEELAAEFGTVAGWTADAVDELGSEYAIVAGCRGSGDPALLDWLATSCGIGTGTAVVDVGAGVGGAAAWVADAYGARPVLVEPMGEACVAARRMFGRSAVQAQGERLPFADGQFEVAWCIGVLCTVHDKPALVRELARVLEPGGSLGMMVLVAEPGLSGEVPEGNEFPTQDELAELLADAGFVVKELVEAPSGQEPREWKQRAEEIDAFLEARHGDDPRWLESEEQTRKLGRLLETRQVTRQVLHAVKQATETVGADG